MVEAPAAAAALTGIRVLDLTTNYAAYAGRLLADLGADVVRVEPPEGSPVRSLAPCQPGPAGESLSFAHAFLDAGKRSVTLDLASTAGRKLLAELAASSDAMIETPSAMAGNGAAGFVLQLFHGHIAAVGCIHRRLHMRGED